MAFPVECADVGHEILAPAAAVSTMATRAVALVHRFAALGVTRPRPGRHKGAAEANIDEQGAPAATLAELSRGSQLAASPCADPACRLIPHVQRRLQGHHLSLPLMSRCLSS